MYPEALISKTFRISGWKWNKWIAIQVKLREEMWRDTLGSQITTISLSSLWWGSGCSYNQSKSTKKNRCFWNSCVHMKLEKKLWYNSYTICSWEIKKYHGKKWVKLKWEWQYGCKLIMGCKTELVPHISIWICWIWSDTNNIQLHQNIQIIIQKL